MTQLLHSIALQNVLSFADTSPALDLQSLNVLIGPNGSGKSNLLEAIGLLRSTAMDMRPVIAASGGVSEWIWKGRSRASGTIEVVVSNPSGKQPLRHILVFGADNKTFRIDDERVENAKAYTGQFDPYFYYRFQGGHPVVNRVGEERRQLAQESFDQDLSILAQRSDPEIYPEITYLKGAYGRIRLYREWACGRNTVFRVPQRADLRSDRLEEDFSNLGLFLNRLRRNAKAKQSLLSNLRDLYEGLSDFDVSIEGGSVQVFFMEGDFAIPATRLSDGSLRYLCLLAVLCDPDPPPLIGIEEPELGLHPDVLPKLADLLVEASARCQLIVTTHSDTLVDALSEDASSVVICEKHDGKSTMCRLHPDELAPWLEKYRLGQLWTRGQLGGTRW
jgi:predicted ATPase